MKRFAGFAVGLALLALAAACTPAPSGPEAVVQAIYKPLVDSKGEKTTSMAEMPLSDELKALVSKAEVAAKDEPVFDGDMAGDCQDCGGFSDLKIAAGAAGAAGHKSVEASFKLFGGEARHVTWDMVETPQGWRVDNVMSSDGIDARKLAQEAIDAAATAQPSPVTPPATPAPSPASPT